MLMKYFLTGIMVCFLTATQAQYTFKAIIRGGEENVLAGATLRWKNSSVVADSTGLAVISNIPAGEQTFVISYVGFAERAVTYHLPIDSIVKIILEEEEEEEVIVTAT